MLGLDPSIQIMVLGVEPEDDKSTWRGSRVAKDGERQAGDRPRSIFERQWVGWAIVIALGLVALIGVVVAVAALPLLVAAFPLTIAAVLVALGIAYVRQRRRSGRQGEGLE